MRIYFACLGVLANTYSRLAEWLNTCDKEIHELRSYWEYETHSLPIKLPIVGKSLFLDSGAFSIFSKGLTIRIENYADFCLLHKDEIAVIANFDDIPKDHSDPECVEAAALQSLKNLAYLESRGINAIPVYHAGEPFEYLEHYLESYDYIAIGGLYEQGEALEKRLDRIWNEWLIHHDVKVHGFGMTSIKLMSKYPWHSVDSSTWLVHSRNGYTAIPTIDSSGKFVFDEGYVNVTVTPFKGTRERARIHYSSRPKAEQEIIERWLASIGLTIEQVSVDLVSRIQANLLFWCAVEEYLNEKKVEVNRKTANQILS